MFHWKIIDNTSSSLYLTYWKEVYSLNLLECTSIYYMINATYPGYSYFYMQIVCIIIHNHHFNHHLIFTIHNSIDIT